MRKQHFIVVLLFAIVAIAFSSRPFYATTWAGTSSNQMVTRAALLDAVNNGVFTANTTIPNDLRLVTREMAQSYVNIQAITGRSMNQLVPKSAFVSATVYYLQPMYGKCVGGDGAAPLAGYPSSSDALTAGTTGVEGEIYLDVNRPPQVGDRVYNRWWNYYDNVPIIGSDDGICGGGSYGYWVFVPSLNGAIRVTAISGIGSQYVLEIVYPSGTTNVTICLAVDIVGNTAAVQAIATANVSTNVTINWGYDINGGGSQIGTPFTINSGSYTSNVININNGSTINSMTVSISDFSPSSHGTQNYVSGGQCY